ncbi:uncharacterized protein LOC135943972 [Cloeon dipterum]|uniref:uncharacterized protein LOC135943972 n=1 Tax=Cloeon dipterum TaxID=197152 RepID=UPI00321FE63E
MVKDLKNSFEKGQVWLMSSVAGAGKSTVLKEITYQLGKSDPDLKILYISLKKHSLTILKIPRLIQFLAHATLHSTDDIKILIEEKRAVVFFDGFDEICPILRENVITLFHSLKERQVPMFIATRPHEAEIIKERINSEVLVGVEPLNEDKQIEFLKVVAGKTEEECKQFICDFEEKDILENPLHLSLIASSKSEGNLYQIYSKVVEKKLELCLVRDGYNIDDRTNFYLKMELASSHLQLIALRFLKNENLIGRGISKEDLEKMNDYGVATVLDGEVTFLHQTFAEFLATKQFLKDFDSSQVLDLELFQDCTSSQCRKFLDLFYSTLDKEDTEQLEDHVEALVAVAKSIGSVIFLKKVAEDNLRQVFRMVKTRISFHAESNLSICMEKSPELLMSAISNEEIAVQLLDMGVLDKTGLEKILPDLLRKIEENNAVIILEKLKVEFSDLPDLIDDCYSNESESRKSLMKVGFTAIRKDFDLLLDLLIQNRIRAVDAFEEEENSLFTACRYGSVKCVRVLLKHGAQEAIYGITRYDPLNVATEFGHLDMVKFLMEEKPSVFKRDETTLVLDGLRDIWNPFQYAVMYGRKEIAKFLLSKCPALIDIRTKDGKTPMHLAVLLRKWEVLEWLAQIPNIDIKSLIPDGDRKNWTQFEIENHEHFLMLQVGVKEKDKQGRTVLHYAAKYGYTDLVAKFLKAGADIEATDANGWNALHFACLKDKNIETIKLLNSRSKHLAKTLTREEQTALHILVENCDINDFGRAISRNLDIARYLFEDAGVDLSIRNGETNMAAREAAERGLDKSLTMFLRAQYIDPTAQKDLKNSSYYSASETGGLLSLQKWIQQGGDFTMRDEHGRTALQLIEEKGKFRLSLKKNEHERNVQFSEKKSDSSLLLACKQKKWDKVKTMLNTKILSMNRQDKDGRTALHYAAGEGNLGIVQKMLNQKADVSLKDHNGWTALHYAILSRHQELVQKLLESGAKIDSKTTRGETALHLTAYKGYTELSRKLIECGADVNSKNKHGLTCVNIATVNRNLDLLEVLLVNNADVNAEYQFLGNTPLHHAALENYPEIVEKLVDYGADVNLQDKKGWTALHFAARYCPELIQKLLDHGSDLTSNEQQEWRALNIAAERNQQLSQKLLDHGADVNLKEQYGWTALHFAARYNPELIQKLLEHGADVNLKTKHGWTALHFAANFFPEMSQKLLNHDADINSKDNDGLTPLHEAARYNPELIQMLLDHGAGVNLADNDGWTALHYAARYNPKLSQKLLDHGAGVNLADKDGWTALHFAARYNPELIQKLLDNGAAVSSKEQDGWTALHFAARYNPEFIDKLLDNGADVNSKEQDGWTALHFVARYNPEFIEKLLDNGADVNLKTQDGWTALHFSAKHNPELIQKILDHGADVNSKKQDGWTALHFAARYNPECIEKLLDHGADVNLKTQDGWAGLHFAARYNPELIQKLLEYGADVNSKEQDGWTALHFAARYNPEFIEKLLDNGADVNLKTQDGWAALHFAARYNPEFIEKLLKYGADVNSKKQDGWTALHFAARHYPELSQKLLDNGADVNSKIRSGWTPLHLAARNFPKLVKKLLYHGADVNSKQGNGWSALHFAARYNPELLETLLDHGADVNSTLKNGCTALHLAIEMNCPESVQKLLVKGADVNLQNGDGFTALQLAKAWKYRVLEELLLDERIICNNLKPTTAPSALQLAIASNNLKETEILMNNGNDFSLLNKYERSILQHALKNFEMVKLLHEKKGELLRQVTNDGSTSLHLAIENDDCPFEVFQWLIEELKIDVNASNELGQTVFMIACGKNRKDVIEYLLANKSIDLSKEDLGGRTALHHAVRSGSVDLVQYLLDHGADLTKKDNVHRNVMFYGLNSLQMILCLNKKNIEFVNEVDTVQNTLLIYAIEFSYMVEGDVFHWLIEESGIDLNAVDEDGNSAINIACKKRMWDIVDTLLTKDVDVRAKDENGKNLLHYAAESGNSDLAQKLVKRGLNPSLKDNLGKNALHYALQHLDIVKSLNRALVKELTKDKNTSLHLAIGMFEYSIDVIRWLIDEAQVDVNAKNENGETPLMTACSKNRFEVIQILLDNKADVSNQDTKGRTALHHAARSGHFDLIKRLFDHLALKEVEDGSSNIQQSLVELVKQVDKENNTLLILAMEGSKKVDKKVISWLIDDIKLDLNAVNCKGKSALLLACKHSKWDAIDILLARADTDIGSKDKKERTPLHWAAATGNLGLVQRLVERGADLTLKDSDGMNVTHHALNDIETVKFLHNLNKGLVKEITKKGNTCLHLAVIRGITKVIRWLVEDEIKVDLEKSNELGLTALLLACRRNMWEVVELLVDNNVDITKPDRAGKTVLNYAEESEHFELVEKLRVLNDANK